MLRRSESKVTILMPEVPQTPTRVKEEKSTQTAVAQALYQVDKFTDTLAPPSAEFREVRAAYMAKALRLSNTFKRLGLLISSAPPGAS